ncbi:TIGR03943 family putative permease subunit [Streptomyces acidiscabies]|uniref:TIGR03943 family protein n=1 Tax=Streptomyces acidiscabies TaxID=42234 RepID=A0AAP6BB34_9ACTN|nr:TIGR03943 family protein [Streptomyces acidiscabies]MBP5937945.1 TIGR03943 family protein [Streptomyces sp. LBUM 1476]MBZ3908945.1 TIGR03943 family protein [Streptomyces acidiscabies]MDX2961481.1 TIGR03943 family protein [Streptomyces acidiscabies]MDX3016651.1 TIGR03943 family protein [Streptomyces acidiscabies]MDX3788444.1 TIGR03943 family protein [Streptomyces acidiscabies]
MNRQAQSAVLFLLGAALLHAGSTDLYLRYVKAGLQPLLLAAGVVLIVAAAATWWYERKQAQSEENHAHREPRISWLLVLPLLALILVAPPALGSYSATRTGTALQEPVVYGKIPATGPLKLALVDYAGRAIYDNKNIKGREIQIAGFLALGKDGTPYLVRMALSCCAADAQPVKVALTGNIPPVLQPDTWLLITGTYSPKRRADPVNGGPIPFIQVTRAAPVAEPRDPYDETWNG